MFYGITINLKMALPTKIDKYFKDHRKRYKYRINQNEINNLLKRISNKVSTNYTWSVDLKNSNKPATKNKEI